jgi:hypothetical protein
MIEDMPPITQLIEELCGEAVETSDDRPSLPNNLEATIGFFVSEYVRFTKLAAEQVVRKCKVLAEAEMTLPPNDFAKFCEKTNLKQKSSTFRKYRKIGQEADRLLAVADRLPADWTTLYLLARLDRPEFDELVTSDALHADITASELSRARSKDPATDKCIFRVDVTSLLDGERAELFREIKEAADRYGAVMSGLPDHLVADCEVEAD